MASSNVSLKLLVDKTNQKVLFAEAGKSFVDFLFTLLSLPMGTIIRLLTKNSMLGCLANLYKSLEDLNDDYMLPRIQKDCLLKPKSSSFSISFPLLPSNEPPPVPPTVATTFYKCTRCTNSDLSTSSRSCRNCNYTMSSQVTHYVPDQDPPSLKVATTFYKCSSCTNSDLSTSNSNSCRNCCNYSMTNKVTHYVPVTSVAPASASAPAAAAVSDGGGFVKGVVTYMVMDDLVVTPMSTISSITMLNKFNIKEVGSLEEKVVEIGMDEGLSILKNALCSESVLTNVFLGGKPAANKG